MAEWAECLLHKYEDLGVNLQPRYRKSGTCHRGHQAVGCVETGGWLRLAVCQPSSRLSERLHLKRVRWNLTEESSSDRHTHTCTHAYAHTRARAHTHCAIQPHKKQSSHRWKSRLNGKRAHETECECQHGTNTLWFTPKIPAARR